MTNSTSESPDSKTQGSASGGPKPCVTVIMANYNGEEFLGAAIESVQKQTLTDLELIICDDASKDGSVEIISRYAAADPRVKLVRNASNTGPAGARNRILELATGSWIAIMDSDDVMHPDRLKTLVANATRDGAALAADDLVVFYQDGAKRSHGLLSGARARKPFWVETADFIRSNTLFSKRNCLGFLKPVIRADALRAKAIRYDETLKIAEDYDFVLRLLMAGAKYRVYPQQLYFYRKHGASISHRLSSQAALAMLEADRRLAPEVSQASPEVRAAFAVRTRSIETVLSFNGLIDALKERNIAGAAVRIARRPRLLLLLQEPASARLSRLFARRHSPTQTGTRLTRKVAL